MPVESESEMYGITFRHIGWAIIFLKITLISFLLITILPAVKTSDIRIDITFFQFILVGFIAQMIDGTLGMAYGVSCSSLLLNFGVAPRVATAAVHTAEVFTTGVSGLSHLKFKNIDKQLFFRIVITGVIGAMIGAYLVSEIFDGNVIKPIIAGYLLILGIAILISGIRNAHRQEKKIKRAELLALFGGFMDAVGGGGWGPIVTSNILQQGKNPRETIGTVSTAEFFVTFFSTGIFMFFVGVESWQIVLGLIVGGVIAAPVGALLAAKVNKRILMILIGIVITITSTYTLYKTIATG
jgi:uncharacterized membrane protein YfcA